jgi:hypothetical protein
MSRAGLRANTCSAGPLPPEDGDYNLIYLATVLSRIASDLRSLSAGASCGMVRGEDYQPAARAMQPDGSALAPMSAGGTVCQFAAEPAGAVPGSDAGGKT